MNDLSRKNIIVHVFSFCEKKVRKPGDTSGKHTVYIHAAE